MRRMGNAGAATNPAAGGAGGTGAGVLMFVWDGTDAMPLHPG